MRIIIVYVALSLFIALFSFVNLHLVNRLDYFLNNLKEQNPLLIFLIIGGFLLTFLIISGLLFGALVFIGIKA